MRFVNDASGETMVETLVSILISSLALILLASVIGTSVRLVTNSRSRMTEFYDNESEIVGTAATPAQSNVDVTFGVPLESAPDASTVDIYETEDGSIAYYERSTP